jgi:hypothetical protein
MTVIVFALPVQSQWAANWIWQSADGPSNTWMCFRKAVTLASAPSAAYARIAADSKYWLWINGRLVVFEGQLKRNPNRNDTYYDSVNLASYLASGENIIAAQVWYWGKEGFSHHSSGVEFRPRQGNCCVKRPEKIPRFRNKIPYCRKQVLRMGVRHEIITISTAMFQVFGLCLKVLLAIRAAELATFKW